MFYCVAHTYNEPRRSTSTVAAMSTALQLCFAGDEVSRQYQDLLNRHTLAPRLAVHALPHTLPRAARLHASHSVTPEMLFQVPRHGKNAPHNQLRLQPFLQPMPTHHTSTATTACNHPTANNQNDMVDIDSQEITDHHAQEQQQGSQGQQEQQHSQQQQQHEDRTNTEQQVPSSLRNQGYIFTHVRSFSCINFMLWNLSSHFE